MNRDNKGIKGNLSNLESLLEKSKEEARYYQKISQDIGKRLLREVDQLSALIAEHKNAEAAILSAKEEWERTFDAVPDLITILDNNFRIVRTNMAMADTLSLAPDQSIGLLCYEHIHGGTQPPPFCPHAKLLQDGQPHSVEVYEKGLGGYFLISVSPLHDNRGRLIGSVHIARDITERKQAEAALRKAHGELEQKVDERTQELFIANENMRLEINERRLAEESLQTTEKELRDQADHLEKVNIALKVLIENRDVEKKRMKENILLNVEKLIMPYIEKLDKGLQDGPSKTYLDIIKTNLIDLVSPFASTLSSKQLRLTPTEIQVADFVRNGLTNKEIASHLNVSIDAVGFHRKNIRKKLGLTKSKTNLRTYLLGLSN